MYKGLKLFFLVLCLSMAAVSQAPRQRLEIHIKDTNGMAIPGAEVTLTLGGVGMRSAVSNDAGVAVIDNVADTDYRASVSAKGFADTIRDVSVNGSLLVTLDVVLSPGEIAETVNVTAERRQVSSEETTAPVSVLDREQIDRKAVNTIGDVFRSLPGTSSVNEGGFQVRPRIRGFDSNRVLVLVDGERLNNSRTATAQSGVELGLVDTGSVESIEVVRGSGSVLYGTDAMAGTVNIITRDTPLRRDAGFHFGADLDTFYSSNENGRRGTASVTGASKYFAFRVSQSLERFGNYKTGRPGTVFLNDFRTAGGAITNDGEVQNSQTHGGNTRAIGRFFVNDKSSLKFSYDRRRESNIGSAGLVGTFTGFFPFSDRDKFSGRYDTVAINKYLQRVSVSGFYQKQQRDFTNILTVPPVLPFFPGIYQRSETITNTRTTGFDVQTDWLLGKRNNLIAGASYFRDNNNDRRTVISASTPTSATQRITNTKSVPDAHLANIAAFAQDEFRVNNRLMLTGGFRFDNFKTVSAPTTGFALPNLTPSQVAFLGIGGLASGMNVTNNAVTGDAGAIYKIDRHFTLSGRVGRSFRTPNIFELFFSDSGSIANSFQVGNSRLKPETGTNVDTSLKFKSEHFVGSFTFFHNSYKNLLATVPAADAAGTPIFITGSGARVYQTQNIDRATIQGFEGEFEAPFKIHLGYLTPNGNVSYLRGDDTAKHEPLNFISPLRTNVGVRWNNFGKAYFFDYNVRIATTQRRLSNSFLAPVNQGGNGGPEPGYVVHDMSGGYYFRKNDRYNFSINLGVSNLFNRAYSEQFTFAPARGRSFTIGTTWQIK